MARTGEANAAFAGASSAQAAQVNASGEAEGGIERAETAAAKAAAALPQLEQRAAQIAASTRGAADALARLSEAIKKEERARAEAKKKAAADAAASEAKGAEFLADLQAGEAAIAEHVAQRSERIHALKESHLRAEALAPGLQREIAELMTAPMPNGFALDAVLAVAEMKEGLAASASASRARAVRELLRSDVRDAVEMRMDPVLRRICNAFDERFKALGIAPRA